MALTLAQANQQRKRAAIQAAETAPAALMEGATGYEVQMAQLHQDQLRLSNLQSTELKVALKAELLPQYAPYIDGVLSAGRGAQDDVVVTIMLWRLDAGDFAGGLDIATYVLEHDLKMVDGFRRTVGCVIAEEVAETALKALRADGGTFDPDILERTRALTESHDMPDQARAKLFVAIGKTAFKSVNPEQIDDQALVQLGIAKGALTRAIELHDACGGKTDLGSVEKLIKKHAGPAS